MGCEFGAALPYINVNRAVLVSPRSGGSEHKHPRGQSIQVGMSVVGVVASLATLGVVFSKTTSLAGWSLADSMVLRGT